MRKKIIIIIFIIIVVLAAILIAIGLTFNKKDAPITKQESEELINQSLSKEQKEIKYIEETDDYYKYYVESDKENIAGTYIVVKDTKEILKEYSGSNTSVSN